MRTSAIVVSQGSIGRRHARLLSDTGANVVVVTSQHEVDYPAAPTLESAAALLSTPPDLVIIASPTARHGDDLATALAQPWRCTLLVEKPIARIRSDLDAALGAHRERQGECETRVSVAFNWRFHPCLVALQQHLAGTTLYSMRLQCSSYLPDWRPRRQYYETSSARRLDGGGVLRDLCHELDFALLLAGDWRDLAALGGHLSDLAIDVEDCVDLLFSTERCPAVSVHLDYVSRKARRVIDVITANGTYQLDFLAGTLRLDGDILADTGRPHVDAMIGSLHAAVQAPVGTVLGMPTPCSWREAVRILDLIEAAEARLCRGEPPALEGLETGGAA